MGFAEIKRLPNIVNIICFIVTFIILIVVNFNPLESTHRGFFCDDENIRYPFKPETITVPVLLVTCLIPTIIVIFTTELAYGFLSTCNSKRRNCPEAANNSEEKDPCEGAKSGLVHGGLVFACLLYGNALCVILTEVFKISFGRLRPSFLSACQPEADITSFPNCSGLYVEDIVCMNPDKERMMDMRKSFVSGHASFSVFNMLFICFYLQRRLPFSTPRLLVALLQAVAIGYAVYVMATRVFDHYHHPQDILGGAILGVVTCSVTIFKMTPNFVLHPPRTELEHLPTTINPKQGTSSPMSSFKTTKE